MSKKLLGKVAVVTGASKGIGAEIAIQMASAGAFVVVNYSSSKEGADKVVKKITEGGGKAVAVQGNMSQPKDIKRLFSEALKAYGKVDILVNNAGVYEFAMLEEVTEEHFRKMFDLNVFGLILASQEAAKHIGKEGGSIINIGSVAGTSPIPSSVVYSATKAAVDCITKTLAKELGGRNIRVNSINPGLVDTEGVQKLGFSENDFKKDVEAHTPLGRIGKPEDIAPAAVFLASEDSKWITGETLFISGGFK